jgi:hypothetical protein
MTSKPTPPTGSDPAAAWRELKGRALPADEHACRDLASRLAYRALLIARDGHPDLNPDAFLRVGRGWHHLAWSAYTLLQEAGAFAHLAGQRPRACAAVEPILRAWLTGTSTEPDTHGQPIAALLHVGDAFTTLNDTTAADHLATLIRAGQDYAVFGVPGHTISLAHSADGPGLVRIVVDPPHGPALATAPVAVTELMPTEVSGVDGAVAALVAVAARVTTLLVDHTRAAYTHPPGHPPEVGPSRPARPFPALTQTRLAPTPPAATSADPTPRTPPPPTHGR